ncbi:MAG: radical SAM protein [Gammaproteobacteria bacterium]|nr:radical SAM protein [Gammaproteobacteria bacterium]
MKIAFISMSGVRVRTEELAKLGVSMPGFVERGNVIASLPSLAGATLAAVTPSDVQFDYFDVADVAGHDVMTGYDLVAFSTFTAMAYECYALAARYRAAGIPVVLGGLHATLMPEEAQRHFDAVCIGEGESLWPLIVHDARAGRLQPVYRQPDGAVYDLAQSPVPRFELFDISRYNRLTVQTSRGCPLDCEFCAASKIFGRYRIKPVAQVMAEIDAILDAWPNPFIEFADDNTFVHKRWSKEFLRELRKRDVRWFTETDVSVADDPELLDLMADSGCQQILVGLESPRARSLNGIDRGNWKQKRHDGYERMIDEAQNRGITVNGCFILGLDSDTPDVFGEVADFVQRTGLLESQVTVLTPFPGTRLYDRLKSEGRLLVDEYWDRCTLFDVNFTPLRMSVEELESGMRWLFSQLYSDAALMRRRRHYMEITKQRMEAIA